MTTGAVPRTALADLEALTRATFSADASVTYEFFIKAAETGGAEQQLRLAKFYYTGELHPHIPQNFKEALRWSEGLAQAGNPEAQELAAAMYFRGAGVKQDVQKARRLWEQASKNGNTRSQVMLGLMHLYGQAGLKKDARKARELWEQAAKRGNANALGMLGRLYLLGEGIKEDAKKARHLWERAAKAGDGFASRALGNMYFHGHGVDPDVGKAARYWEQAAKRGDTTAKRVLGLLHVWGDHDFEKNQAKGLALLEEAANGGDGAANFALGRMYRRGDYVERDEKKALSLWQKAAELGDALAQFELGLLYLHGRGVEKNVTKGNALLQQASTSDEAETLMVVGLFYWDGDFIPRDVERALSLWQRAAALGHKDARNVLKIIERSKFDTGDDTRVLVSRYLEEKKPLAVERVRVQQERLEPMKRDKKKIALAPLFKRADEVAASSVRGRPGSGVDYQPKVDIKVRLSSDVLDWLKENGPVGTRANALLTALMEAEKGGLNFTAE